MEDEKQMNLTEHVVTKVLTAPYFKYMWCVDVEADSWGNIRKTTIYFQNKDDAELVKAGYEFNA